MKYKIGIIAALTFGVILLFMFWAVNPVIFEFAVTRRFAKVMAMCVVGIAIATSTLLFQTISTNRILTPSILGLDALYILINLGIAILLGVDSIFINNAWINFILSSAMMCLFSLGLYKGVFSKGHSVYMVIMIGVIMGTFFTSISGMIQLVLSPDAYDQIMRFMFADFNFVKRELLLISSVILLFSSVWVLLKHHELDVLSLGRAHATNLGVAYNQRIKKYLIIVFLQTAVATALVGPVTFLGFLSVNIAKTLLPTHRHLYLWIGSSLIAVFSLVLGQFLVEHIFGFAVPIGILISLFGGGYFIIMLLKEQKR